MVPRTYCAFEAVRSVLERGHPTYAGVEDEEVNCRFCLQQEGWGVAEQLKTQQQRRCKQLF